MAEQQLLEDNKRQIGTQLDYLKSCDDYRSKEALDAISFLRNTVWSLGPGKAKNHLCSDLTDFMVEKGLTSLIVKMVRSLTGSADVSAFDSRCELNKAIYNIACVLKSTIAMPIRLELIKNGILRALLDDLESCDPNTKDPRQRIRIIDDLFRLQNLVLTPGSISYYREAGSVDTLMTFVQANDVNTKIFSMRVLACIVSEEESQRLVATGCMEPMIDMLRKAAQSPDTKYQYVFVVKVDKEERVFKSTLKTLTEGIVNLSSNDVNKTTIVAYGGIPVLASIFKPEYTDNQKYAAAEALWKLAFLESNREIILNHLSITDTAALHMLKEMQSSKTPKLRDVSTGLLHQLGLVDIHKKPSDEKSLDPPQKASPEPSDNLEKTPEDPPPSYQESTETSSSHVMISYQWDHQERALKVRDQLKASGYNVWMDVDKMEGNILVAMANAVEKADVILLCVSRAYKGSANCQTEANYSYGLKKPMIPLLVEADYKADGWLGALIAMKLYTRAYSDGILEKDMPALIRELGNRGGKV
ncbi:uncharacterized protein [Amphiura filiformis]|uniref:uncharacterized protein n=1 Tax=Amphiura filiformis TaxID=82378 RepID=UPI003B2152EF